MLRTRFRDRLCNPVPAAYQTCETMTIRDARRVITAMSEWLNTIGPKPAQFAWRKKPSRYVNTNSAMGGLALTWFDAKTRRTAVIRIENWAPSSPPTHPTGRLLWGGWL